MQGNCFGDLQKDLQSHMPQIASWGLCWSHVRRGCQFTCQARTSSQSTHPPGSLALNILVRGFPYRFFPCEQTSPVWSWVPKQLACRLCLPSHIPPSPLSASVPFKPSILAEVSNCPGSQIESIFPVKFLEKQDPAWFFPETVSFSFGQLLSSSPYPCPRVAFP